MATDLWPLVRGDQGLLPRLRRAWCAKHGRGRPRTTVLQAALLLALGNESYGGERQGQGPRGAGRPSQAALGAQLWAPAGGLAWPAAGRIRTGAGRVRSAVGQD